MFNVIFSYNHFFEKLKDLSFYFFYQIYKFLFIFPAIPISFILLSVIAIFFSFIPGFREKAAIAIMCNWARFICAIVPVYYDVEGLENIDNEQSYVILANHTSLADALLIYNIFGTKIRTVMKKELRDIPIFGYTCQRMGNIIVDRSNSDSAITSINAAKKKIKNGISIFFFPEGTRNKEKGLKPFKKGAFHIALDMELPILPVTILGASKICSKGSILSLFPGRVKVVIHDSINTKEYSKDNIDNLIKESFNSIESGLIDS